MAGRIDDALRATRNVCRALGLPADDLDVIRSSSYVVIRIGGTPYVARSGGAKATSTTHGREIGIARALAAAGAPVAQPAPLPEPLFIDGPSAVGLWMWVDEVPGARPSMTQLGSGLRAVHDCAAGLDLAALDLPPFRAPYRALDRLRRLVDRKQVHTATAEALAAVVQGLGTSGRNGSSGGLVHGDFRPANVLVASSGPVVIDFDAASDGPPDWDLTLIAQQHRHFGLHAADLDAFLGAYGGVADVASFEALCRLRDVTSAVWALAMAAGIPAFRPEAGRRVESVLQPDHRSPWSWDGLPSARPVH